MCMVMFSYHPHMCCSDSTIYYYSHSPHNHSVRYQCTLVCIVLFVNSYSTVHFIEEMMSLNNVCFICTVQPHETTVTTAQLSHECSDEALLQLSSKIAGYNIYKLWLGLSDAEIDAIDQNPATFYNIPGRFYTALKIWKSRSIDIDNPPNSTATYGRLVEIATKIEDGEAVRSIHKACVEHTSELPSL